MDRAIERYHFAQEQAFEMLVLEVFLVVVSVGIAYSSRGLFSQLGLPPWITCLLPGLLLIALPLHFAQGGYVYDFPEILLATVLTRLFLVAKWSAYYPVLTLAVLNRDPSIVFIGFCAAFLIRRDAASLWRHALLHALFLVPPVLATRFWFATHGGSHCYFLLSYNIEYFCSMAPCVARENSISPFIPTPASINLFLVALVMGLLLSGARRKPPILWHMFIGVMALVVPLYMVFGWRNEIRVIAMTFPIASCLAAFTIRDMFAIAPSERHALDSA